MDTIGLAQKYISEHGFKVLDESDEHIVFKFRMNILHLYGYSQEPDFMMLTLPNFAEVTDSTISEVKEKCHSVNKDIRQIKLYVMDNVILANAEIYYMGQEDFAFQMQKALNNLISAKAMYNRLTL